MESNPCVSIEHMFKERTFWKFLCVINRPMPTCIMCRCTSQVLGDLVKLYGAWLLSLALSIPSRDVREAETAVHGGVKADSQVHENSALWLRYARFLRRFTRVMQTNVEWEQCSCETTLGRRRWARNSSKRLFESSSWSIFTGESPENADVELVSTIWIFALLTTLYRTCNAKVRVTSWATSSPPAYIGYMFENGIF